MTGRSNRDKHLASCKSRALAILAKGDRAGAIASMISDIGKADPPLYAPDVFLPLINAALALRGDAECRSWIEGFG